MGGKVEARQFVASLALVTASSKQCCTMANSTGMPPGLCLGTASSSKQGKWILQCLLLFGEGSQFVLFFWGGGPCWLPKPTQRSVSLARRSPHFALAVNGYHHTTRLLTRHTVRRAGSPGLPPRALLIQQSTKPLRAIKRQKDNCRVAVML